MSHTQLFHILFCDFTKFHADIVFLGTCVLTIARHYLFWIAWYLQFFGYSASIEFYVTWHLLTHYVSWHLQHCCVTQNLLDMSHSTTIGFLCFSALVDFCIAWHYLIQISWHLLPFYVTQHLYLPTLLGTCRIFIYLAPTVIFLTTNMVSLAPSYDSACIVKMVKCDETQLIILLI